MRKTIIGVCLIGIFALTSHAQNSTLEGYVFEEKNRGYLEGVSIKVVDATNRELIAHTFTNQEGIFVANVPVGKTYTIQAEKVAFLPKISRVKVRKRKQDKKVYVKIKMRRPDKSLEQPVLTEKTGVLAPPPVVAIAESYGIDSDKIVPSANPDGVALSAIVTNQDPYAEVTNATRLADENYDNAADREALKYEEIPTAYEPTVKIKPTAPRSEKALNEDMPSAYQPKADKKIIVPAAPQFGETIVATANHLARTKALPNYYTGYKIEFITSFTELPPSHEIFSRHGNIVMERRSNGLYSYLLGDFVEQAAGQKFLEESMVNRYPGANLIAYKNGERVVIKGMKQKKTKPVSAPPR